MKAMRFRLVDGDSRPAACSCGSYTSTAFSGGDVSIVALSVGVMVVRTYISVKWKF